MKLKQYEQEYRILYQVVINESGLEKTENDIIKETDKRFYNKFGIEYIDVLYGEE